MANSRSAKARSLTRGALVHDQGSRTRARDKAHPRRRPVRPPIRPHACAGRVATAGSATAATAATSIPPMAVPLVKPLRHRCARLRQRRRPLRAFGSRTLTPSHRSAGMAYLAGVPSSCATRRRWCCRCCAACGARASLSRCTVSASTRKGRSPRPRMASDDPG